MPLLPTHWDHVSKITGGLRALSLPPYASRNAIWAATHQSVAAVFEELRKLGESLDKVAARRPQAYLELSLIMFDLRSVVENLLVLLNERGAFRLFLEAQAQRQVAVLKAIHYDVEFFIRDPLEAVVEEAHQADKDQRSREFMRRLQPTVPGMQRPPEDFSAARLPHPLRFE